MKVGDLVKSFDFVGDYSCYMLGLVEEISLANGTVTCHLVGRIFQDEVVETKMDKFTAPLNGQFMFDRADFPRILVCE
jgi:hypothetical protein